MDHLIDVLLEKDLVSYLLEYPHTTEDASKLLTEKAFTDNIMKASYLSCVELFQQKGTFTRAEVFRAVKTKESGDSAKILTMKLDRATNLEDICHELVELQTKRGLLDVALNIERKIREGEASDNIIGMVSESTTQIDNSLSTEAVSSISKLIEDAFDALQENAGKTRFSGVDTGSRKLNYTFGGWQAGFIIIAARPSAGKTIVGLDLAKKSSLAGFPTLFVSLEMPATQLMYRYISSEFPEIPYSDLGAYRVSQDQLQEIRKSDVQRLKELPLHFYDSDNRDINYLSNMISAEVRKKKIQLIVVDYLQLIRDGQIKDQSDFAQVSSISNKLQRLSRKLQIPIIALSQLSRAVETRTDKRPQLADIRSSGNIEQDASIVIGLYRPHYYALQEARANGIPEPTQIDTTLEFVILKNRNGMTGSVIRHVDVLTNRVEDEPEALMRFDRMPKPMDNKIFDKVPNDFLGAGGSDVLPF